MLPVLFVLAALFGMHGLSASLGDGAHAHDMNPAAAVVQVAALSAGAEPAGDHQHMAGMPMLSHDDPAPVREPADGDGCGGHCGDMAMCIAVLVMVGLLTLLAAGACRRGLSTAPAWLSQAAVPALERAWALPDVRPLVVLRT